MVTSRSQRAAIAGQTVAIMDRGNYLSNGVEVSIRTELSDMRDKTLLYCPDELNEILSQLKPPINRLSTQFSVANCTTFAAAHRLIDSGLQDPLCLNFASAKHAGGGFLNGAQAQEEALARASGLYQSLQTQPEYYAANRTFRSSLYTNHLIYSPKVPVFRDDNDALIPNPFLTSIITSPAVNAGAVRKNEPQNIEHIESTMYQRIRTVLAVAAIHAHESLVLGAWGCGVFQNNPCVIAKQFHDILSHDIRFAGRFKHVTFGVLDFSKQLPTFRAFESVFRD